jgi:hypothetical protein
MDYTLTYFTGGIAYYTVFGKKLKDSDTKKNTF